MISFSGVALIASGQPGGLSFGAGASFVLAAAVCQAVSVVLQRPLIARYGALTCVSLAGAAGAVCLAPWLPAAIEQARLASSPSLAATIYLSIFPAAIGYATLAIAQAHFGTGVASTFLYLVPPTTLVIAFFIGHEVPSLQTLLGGALAIAGVVLVNTKGRV